MSRISGNLVVTGNLKAGSFDLPVDTVGDANMDASDPIDVDKQIHQYVHTYSQNRGASVAAERKAVFTAWAPGTIVAVKVGVTQAAVGDSTATVDVYKNGVSVLSSAITIDNGDATFTPQDGALASPGYSIDQVIEVVVTVSPGTGTPARGLYVGIVTNEAAS